MIRRAAFWKRESKNGRRYYQGRMGDGKLLLFHNEHKKEENHPDLILCVVPQPEKREQKQNGQTNDETGEEDIPF